MAAAKMNFAFETTLSGHSYLPLLKRWKAEGYHIEIIYLRLKSALLSLQRVADLVRQGGHNIPEATIVRRFDRGWENFLNHYQALADQWAIYENSSEVPELLQKKNEQHTL